MKLLKLTILLWVIAFSHSYAQTKNEQYILDRLNDVKQECILDDTASYVIDENESKVSYKEFKGKWLLIDFWSTGCGPCIKEFPALAKFYEKNKEKINVIAVSVDNGFKRYKKSAKRYKIGVPHYFGGYTYKNPLFNLNIKTYKKEDGTYKFITTTPQYVLINPEGKIIDKDFPKPSHPDFEEKLQQAFGKSN